MSFGRPPSINVGFKPSPPDRGSFPLDHYGEIAKIFFHGAALSQHEANARTG
jgi:cytochrome c oxidase assembly protein subunit 19